MPLPYPIAQGKLYTMGDRPVADKESQFVLALDLATTLLKANVPPAVLAQLQPPRWQARRLRAA